MTGSEIVQIVSLVLTALVSIVTLLVRARIIALEGEIKDLNVTIKAANALIVSQGITIDTLSQTLIAQTPTKVRQDKPSEWQGNQPYRQQK